MSYPPKGPPIRKAKLVSTLNKSDNSASTIKDATTTRRKELVPPTTKTTTVQVAIPVAPIKAVRAVVPTTSATSAGPSSRTTRPVTTARAIHPPQVTATPSAAALASQFLLSQLNQATTLSTTAYEASSKQLMGGISLLEAEVGDATRRRIIEKEIEWLEGFESAEEGVKNILGEVGNLLIQCEVMIERKQVVGEISVDQEEKLYDMQIKLDISCEKLQALELSAFPSLLHFRDFLSASLQARLKQLEQLRDESEQRRVDELTKIQTQMKLVLEVKG